MPPEISGADELDGAAWIDLQRIVRSFREALRRGERPRLETYLSRAEVAPPRMVLVELVHEELEYRHKAGEPVSAASYLQRFPKLTDDPQLVAELDEAAARDSRRADSDGATEAAGTPTPTRIGRYELCGVIGRGSFGDVYRAWDPTLGREVALKRPRPGWLAIPQAVDRFLREARVAACLFHPHIVPVHDVGQVDAGAYLVSALVEGKNLAEVLASGRPSFRQSADWIASLADALEYAHQHGVIHRDVKPSNLLIDARGQALLTDFGLAKLAGGQAGPSRDGHVIGTPAYVSPEQARGESRVVDNRSDVYSLGVVLYELLTGVRPFQGSERMLLVRIQEEEPSPPRRLDDGIPRDLETVCLKAMAKEPAHRYPDAASFAADLRRHLRGEPVLARRVGRVGTLWRTCRRKPLVSGLAAALVLAVLLGFVGVSWQWRRAQSQRDQALLALSSQVGTLSSALDLALQKPGHPDDLQRRRDAILDAARACLLDQARTYPELREVLGDLTMAALSLAHQTASMEGALSAYEKTRASFESLVRDDPTYLSGRDCVARCLGGEGMLLVQMGRIEEGVARLRESADQWRLYGALIRKKPTHSPAEQSAREAWAATELMLAEAETRLGRRSEAVAVYR